MNPLRIPVMSLCSLLMLTVQGQDLKTDQTWAETWQQGKTAEAENDLETALQQYELSEKLAGKPTERLSSIEARCRILRKQGKHAAAEKTLRDALQRSDFEAPQYRRLLNQLAGLLMWGPHQNEALDFVNQARFFATKSENDRYATHNISACIYWAQGQYEAVIEIMQPWAIDTHAHPANQYSAGVQVANAWRKLGFTEKAKEYYETALVAGKKVTYKFDCSEAEKTLKQLSKNP